MYSLRPPRNLTNSSLIPEGEFLAQQAEKYLKFLHDTQEKLKEFKETTEAEILVGSSYTYSKYTLTDLLLKYRMNHPNVNFTVVNDQSNVLFRKMLEGSIDVAFIRGDYEGAVNKTMLGKNEAYLVTKEPVDMEALPSMQRIGYKTNDRTKELLEKWWENWYGTEFPAGMVVGYIDVAWQLIARGIGYTVCFLPENFENQYNLCLTPLKNKDGSSVTRNTWFLYSKNKRISRTLEDFITYIEKGAKENERH